MDKKTTEVVEKVLTVIEQGKISKTKDTPQYCFVNTFPDGIVVYTKDKINTESDIFMVYKRGSYEK